MSWSPSSDYSRKNTLYDQESSRYSPKQKLHKSKASSPSSVYQQEPGTIPGEVGGGDSANAEAAAASRVIDDAEFCSLPNRTPVSCSICGKVYRHKISYLKHQWEHHELWDTCLRFNVSKHQQVQMMEAAQILVDMVNTNPLSRPAAPIYSSPVASSKSSDNEASCTQ